MTLTNRAWLDEQYNRAFLQVWTHREQIPIQIGTYAVGRQTRQKYFWHARLK